MSFYYPLGLLGLIGIPIIIIIYIIKSKYTEQTIASTYLWELSEKFLKRRKPISKLTGIVTLILQILAVVILSFLVAHPKFKLSESANDYYFILDGSASMHIMQGDVSRFKKGQDEINDIIDDAKGGSSYTLVFVGDTIDVVFEGVTDKDQAKVYVNELSAGWSESDCAAAVSIAQEKFEKNKSGLFYLVTDKKYAVGNAYKEESGDVFEDALKLIDVSANESNYAFRSYGWEYGERGVKGVGEVVSYTSDATIKVEMRVSKVKGDKPAVADSTRVSVKAGVPAEFALTSELSQFAYIELRITSADAFAEDNVVVIYDSEKMQERNVLIVSDADDTTYLVNAIRNAGKANVSVMSVKKYAEASPSGYGMYVFNGYTPKELPVNAAIWLVDGIDGSGSGSKVSFREYNEPVDTEGPNSYYVAKYTNGSSAVETMFTKDLVRREVAIRKYAKYSARGFTPVMSVNGDDVVFAGLNANNDRQVVFGFRLGDTNFGLSDDFLILTRNLMNYSFPAVIDETVYTCGDTMYVNVVPGCENIVAVSPSGKSTTLDTVGNDICEVFLNETGVYTLNVRLTSGETQFCAFACVPQKESAPDVGGSMLLNGKREYKYSDGFYDDLLAFFIVIAVLLLADWAVYCYEQYQLR